MTQPVPQVPPQAPQAPPPAAKFYYADGSEVEPENLEEAVKRGIAGPQQGARVPMLDASGTPKWVSAENFWTAMEQGWTYESSDQEERRKFRENAGLLEHGKAGAEGLASGLTFGGSDFVLEKLSGDESDRARQLRAEELSGTRGAFEFAGTVIPALVSGGSSLGAKGLLAAGKTALRNTPAGLVARGAMAAERGIARALPEASSALGRIGQKALTTAVGGAIEGGAYEAGRTLSEAALAPGGDYEGLGERMLASAKDGAVFGAMAGGLLGAGAGAGKEVLSKTLSSDVLGSWARKLRDESTLKALGARGSDVRKLRTEAKIAQVADDLRNYRLANGERVMGTVESSESLYAKVLQGHDEVMGRLDGFRKELADAGVSAGPVAQKWLDDVDEIVVALETSPSQTIQGQGARVRGETQYLRDLVEAGEDITYSDLRDVQRAMKSVIYPDQVPGQGLPAQPPEWAANLLKAERRLEANLEEFADMAFPNRAGEYRTLRRQAESFEKARSLGEKAVMQNLGNRWASLTDNLWGTAGMVGGWMTGGLGAAAAISVAGLTGNHFARKFGRSIVAEVAERAMKFDKAFESRLRGYFQGTSTATKRSGSFAASKLGIGSRNEKEAEKAYNEVARNLEQASQAAFRPVVMDSGAPKTAMAARGKAQLAAQYLVSKLPVPPARGANPNILRAQGYRPPTRDELTRFARTLAVVNDPTEALAALESNSLTKEHVEALQVVYPRLYQNIRTAAVDSLSDANELMPHWKRVQLGLLLDLPLDPSLNPEHIRISQSIYSTAAPQSGGMAPNQAGPSINLSRKLATQVERIEAGEIQ